MFKNYVVTLSIDIEAESAKEAAEQAHEIFAHPDCASLYTYDVECLSWDIDEPSHFTFNMKDQLTDRNGKVKD